MRHQHHRQPEGVAQPQHQLVEGAGGVRVEAGRGLVQEQQLRVERQRAREGAALAHAAAQRLGQPRPSFGAQADERKPEQRELARQRLGQARVLAQRHHHVLEQAEAAEQRIVLEEHAHAPAQREELALGRARRVAAEQHHAPGARAVQQQHHAQQRGLARAAAADEGEDLAAAHLEVDAGVHALGAEARLHALQPDHRLAARVRHSPSQLKTTENAASVTMMRKIACTTLSVVWRPTLSALAPARKPRWQPTRAMRAANTGALPTPTR